MGKYIPRKWEAKKAGVAILTSDKIDLKIGLQKIRTLHNDQGVNPRGRHNNCNIYVLNTGATQYIRQTLTDIKGEIDRNTVI